MKPVADISGGEARRLALAILVSSDSNLLILDEPTNHLDVESREALEDALQAFGGTVLLISHDRALLEAVGSRTIVFEGGRLRSHHGGWAEYRAAEQQAADEAKAAAATPAQAKRGRAQAGPSKNRIADAKRLEAEVEAAEQSMRALEDELADPAVWSDPKRSASASERHERARRELDDLYARSEQALEHIGQAG
jgi:ATP-binding cassette subfamily F protein 3